MLNQFRDLFSSLFFNLELRGEPKYNEKIKKELETIQYVYTICQVGFWSKHFLSVIFVLAFITYSIPFDKNFCPRRYIVLILTNSPSFSASHYPSNSFISLFLFCWWWLYLREIGFLCLTMSRLLLKLKRDKKRQSYRIYIHQNTEHRNTNFSRHEKHLF